MLFEKIKFIPIFNNKFELTTFANCLLITYQFEYNILSNISKIIFNGTVSINDNPMKVFQTVARVVHSYIRYNE